MDEYNDIELTKAEQRAIAQLQKLADKWPKSLFLFSQSGNLVVLKFPNGKRTDEMLRYTVANIDGIPNDGGDADY